MELQVQVASATQCRNLWAILFVCSLRLNKQRVPQLYAALSGYTASHQTISKALRAC